MLGGFSGRTSFALPTARLKTLLLVWLAAEVLVFALAIKMLGVGGAILLTLASSLVGMLRLRRLGLEAVQHVRNTMAGGTTNATMIEGTLAGLGAFLLIVPGFVSDAAGLALAAPSFRRRMATWLRLSGDVKRPNDSVGANIRRGPDVIDLKPEDWSVIEKPRRT